MPSSDTPEPIPPPHSPSEDDMESGEDRHMKVGMKMVGSAMVFIGFIQVFMSASTGAEITTFPMILYFTGLALWAYSSIDKQITRYAVMAASIVCALAFFHFGEVLFWHKYVIYWGTIIMVVYFMFQTPKPQP
ncbi:MAG: hypothetical protein GKS05_08720 [Nitrospirales bacterium]|nr:hypothetical protein [Nitrospirales bacterium]